LISGGNYMSQPKSCLEAARHFMLSEEDARANFAHQIEIIENNWSAICEEAEFGEVDKNVLRGRAFLNPYSVVRY